MAQKGLICISSLWLVGLVILCYLFRTISPPSRSIRQDYFTFLGQLAHPGSPFSRKILGGMVGQWAIYNNTANEFNLNFGISWIFEELKKTLL